MFLAFNSQVVNTSPTDLSTVLLPSIFDYFVKNVTHRCCQNNRIDDYLIVDLRNIAEEGV